MKALLKQGSIQFLVETETVLCSMTKTLPKSNSLKASVIVTNSSKNSLSVFGIITHHVTDADILRLQTSQSWAD